MAKIKWIHISDIHIKGSNEHLAKYNREYVLAALWKDIQARANLNADLKRLDFAFITGDFAWSGSDGSDEYDQAYNSLILPLTRHAEIDIEKIFLVPGNHDIARSTRTEDVLKIEQRLNKRAEINQLFLDPKLKDDRLKVFSRLTNYINFVGSRLPHLNIEKNTGTYSFKVSNGKMPIRVIGLNSAWLSQGGEADRQQLSLAEPIVFKAYEGIEENELTITLIHHPIYSEWYNPSNLQTLQFVRSKSRFLLSGHVHQPDVYSMMALGGNHIGITAGSVFENREWKYNSYNYVVFDTETRKGQIYLRRYHDVTPRGPEFLADIENTGDRSPGVSPIQLFSDKGGDQEDTLDNFRHFINEQQNDLNKRPLLSELYPGRDSMSILFPDVYVDPYVEARREPFTAPIRLSEWLQNKYKEEMKVLVLGGAGGGKTTSLINVNYIYTKRFYTELNSYLPIFTEARNYPWQEPLSISEIVETLKSRYGLSDKNSALMLSGEQKALYLIDAVDEAFPNVYLSYQPLDLNKVALKYPHIMTCRTDFYVRNLSNNAFSGEYNEILDIQPWELDREVDQFLINYISKIQSKEEPINIDEVKKYLKLLAEKEKFRLNPISVTVFLLLWMYERDEIRSNPIQSFGDLLDRFVVYWSRKEIQRDNKLFKDETKLRAAYEIAAWEIYISRQQSTGPITLDTIVQKVSSSLKLKNEAIIKDRAFLSLLITKYDRIDPSRQIVVSFAHEAIYEYFLANRLVKALIDGSNPDILSKSFGHSINRLARELLEIRTAINKAKLIDTLKIKYYRENKFYVVYKNTFRLLRIQKYTRKKENAGILKRLHITYFWGRLEAKIGGASIKELFNKLISKEIEEHELIFGTVGSSVLLLNEPKLEKIYLDKISDDGTYDKCNRLYHLVYYGDASYAEPEAFLHDDFKFGEDDWQKTRVAILSRLKSVAGRDKALRGLDIVTFRRLYETRRAPKLTPDEIGVIKSCLNTMEFEKDRYELLLNEQQKLMALII